MIRSAEQTIYKDARAVGEDSTTLFLHVMLDSQAYLFRGRERGATKLKQIYLSILELSVWFYSSPGAAEQAGEQHWADSHLLLMLRKAQSAIAEQTLLFIAFRHSLQVQSHVVFTEGGFLSSASGERQAAKGCSLKTNLGSLLLISACSLRCRITQNTK